MKSSSRLLALIALTIAVSCSKPEQTTDDTNISDTIQMSNDYLNSGEEGGAGPEYPMPEMTPEEAAWVERLAFGKLHNHYATDGPVDDVDPVKETLTFDGPVFSMVVYHAGAVYNEDGRPFTDKPLIDSIEVDGQYYLEPLDNKYLLKFEGQSTFYTNSAASDYSGIVMNGYTSNVDVVEPDTIDLELPLDHDIELSLKALIQPLTPKDVEGMTKEELSYLRNSIFARLGHTFKTPNMVEYFKKKEWYTAVVDDASKNMNKVQKQNVDFIKKLEAAK